MIEKKDALISYEDRGFLFGDGIFETMIINNKKPVMWNYHIDRLNSGLDAIKISFDTSKLLQQLESLIQYNNITKAIAKIIITRGIGSKGYLPNQNNQPTLIIELKEIPKIKHNIDLYVSSYKKTNISSAPINMKLIQSMNSILSKMEAQNNHCDDGLLLNNDNFITETSSSNIFWVKNDIIYTPDLKLGLLEGTMRKFILNEFEVKEIKANINELSLADEVFISNSVSLLQNVKNIKPYKFSYSNHKYYDMILLHIQKYINNE